MKWQRLGSIELGDTVSVMRLVTYISVIYSAPGSKHIGHESVGRVSQICSQCSIIAEVNSIFSKVLKSLLSVTSQGEGFSHGACSAREGTWTLTPWMKKRWTS